ncbi:MAG: histidinol-phosphatase [Erysipelotrichaceae bacterium]|nr:histidinol-phosphatase [Erysipelotrichaceae bacterium]
MLIYNYHTHTARCGHASGSDEEYVQAAIKAGYKILGFSDHAPFSRYYRPGNHMHWEELDGYLESILSLKEKYKDQIEILVGLESEHYDFATEERRQLKERIDYMLLGQHYTDPYTSDGISFFKEVSDDKIMEYADTVCKALDTGIYTYLCHPDVFLNHQNVFTEACGKAAHMIGKKCEETKTPVEINIRGIGKGLKPFDYGEDYWYPNKKFWTILSQYDIRATVGIDAHDPKDLLKLDDIDRAMGHLKDLNIKIIEEPFI